jgi:hypothetical protein
VRLLLKVLLPAKLLLALSSTVILDSESHGTHGHILLSDGSGSLQTLFSRYDVPWKIFYTESARRRLIELDYRVMAHAQKTIFVYGWNARVHILLQQM